MENKRRPSAVFITDTHLNKDNGNLVKSIFDQVIKICKERNIRHIYHGGDVFTSRSGQPLSCLTDWKEILQKITKSKLQLHVIPGNHDKTDADSERSYLDVYTEPCLTVHSVGECVFGDGIYVGFVPYFTDERWLKEYGNVEDLLNSCLVEHDIDGDTPKILITHSGFDGVMNNDGSKVESLIKPSMFGEWTKVLIGHYHNASKLAKNVIYTGSTYQKDFGETITDKGCTIIYNDGSLEHVPLKFPKYIREVLDVNDAESLNNLLEKYDGEETDHIRFVFRGKRSDANKVDTAKLSALGIDAKFEAEEETEAMDGCDGDAVISYDKRSITRDFMKFCSENSIKGKHLKYGLQLIKTL